MPNLSRTIFVYGLTEKKNDESIIRYVGVSRDPIERVKEHVRNAHRHKSHKNEWIKKLIKYGERPGLEIIDECKNHDEAFVIEKQVILLLMACGAKLTNSDLGGRGGKQLNAKARARMAKAHTGKKHSAEHRAAISRANKGQNEGGTLSDSTKKKMSQAQKGKRHGSLPRPLYQIDTNGNIVSEFESLREASRQTKFNRWNVQKCLNNKTKSAYGYKWKYK